MAETTRRSTRRRLAVAAVVATIIAGFMALLYSPVVYQWGSTPAERAAQMVGDDIVDAASMVATRSITIDRPAEEVWPWLMQMGVDRGGFYTYDWAERLFADPMHNSDVIVAKWQTLAVGDFVHPFPPERGLPSWRVRHLIPESVLVLATDDGSWSWATELQPVAQAQTRLVTRMRGQRTALSVVLDPADLIVFPRVLVGVKQRAEGTLPGMHGTFTADPLPTARLPVHWWAALMWLAGTGVVTRALGAGMWHQSRRHPGIVVSAAFVAGAGYMIMSDTPPAAFLTARPAVGAVGAVLVAGTGWWLLQRERTDAPRTLRRAGRAAVAAAEAGLLVVLPVTTIWQTAAALGYTQALLGRLLTGTAAVVSVALLSACITMGERWSWQRVALPCVMAAGFLLTGSGLIPLLGAALLELIPAQTPGRTGTTSAFDTPVDGERIPALLGTTDTSE